MWQSDFLFGYKRVKPVRLILFLFLLFGKRPLTKKDRKKAWRWRKFIFFWLNQLWVGMVQLIFLLPTFWLMTVNWKKPTLGSTQLILFGCLMITQMQLFFVKVKSVILPPFFGTGRKIILECFKNRSPTYKLDNTLVIFNFD